MVLTSLRSFLLLETDYEVGTWRSPREVLRQPRQEPRPDHFRLPMPDVNGIEFLLEVNKIHPSLRAFC
jgi:hypothetical protein